MMDNGGPATIDEITRRFCQKVIENTVESLRSYNSDFSDDQIDRLKSQWEQRWRSNLQRLEEEAIAKKN